MKFNLHRENGALNSREVFDAVEIGLRARGHEISSDPSAIPVIWSVLWNGRMAKNKFIYEKAKSLGKPVMILEVGNFKRNTSWRVSIDNVNGTGIFGNQNDLDPSRIKKLEIKLEDPQKKFDDILIACQHFRSLQWEGMKTPQQWLEELISNIKKYTDRRIIVRHHPRSYFEFSKNGILVEKPKKILNTYDDFDINYDFYCVINHNSGPAIHAAIKGTPIICDKSSLAYPVSDKLENLENISLKNRENWILELAHTEWFLDEIANGIPIARLEPFLLDF